MQDGFWSLIYNQIAFLKEINWRFYVGVIKSNILKRSYEKSVYG